MALLKVATDLVVLKQTLEFFKKLGFNDQYIEEIEKDLSSHEQKLAELLKDDVE